MSVRSVAKLSAPRLGDILRRPRVLSLIDRSLVSGMCWIAAPAGYGKTTAVLDFLRQSEGPHVWLRIDEADQDVARLFHYLALSLSTSEAVARMPVFGPEYAEQPHDFARLFFRAFFSQLVPGTVLVLDDLHYADTPEIRAILAMMLRELPDSLRCICLSRTLPQDALRDLAFRGQLVVLERSALEFSDSEARELLRLRLKQGAGSIDVTAARGWALGVVLLGIERRPTAASFSSQESEGRGALFDLLGRYFFEPLTAADQDMLLKLALLPEIRIEVANAMIGSDAAGRLLERLYERQLMVTRAEAGGNVFQLHDLLRDFLAHTLAHRMPANEVAGLRERAAIVLRESGRVDDAISLALHAEAWSLARELILERAESTLTEGRRATFIEWCSRLPISELDGWLQYWLGVAHMPDDAAAERWLSKAWAAFEQAGDLSGQCLTVSRAVLVKTNSWRTYEGLSTWTRRALQLIELGLPILPTESDLLVRIGMLRALNFADEYYRDGPAGRELTNHLLERLVRNPMKDPSGLRLLASESLIEHSISTMQPEVFAQAVDSVVEDLGRPEVLPWIMGVWLIAFGSKSGRFFPYTRRAFPYPTAEDALRAAIALGERESLRNIEFGGLYHLQMQMKYRNDFGEWDRLIARLAEIADSRFTTQVAVVADCQAALHARQGNFAEAYRDCDRFMAAIEAANEPMRERWPHYLTQFQVLLADRKPKQGIDLLTDLRPRLDGGAHKRAGICILAATALDSKWSGDARYVEHLAAFMTELRTAKWGMVLLNLPELLAELLADALDNDIAVEFCQSITRERRLLPPADLRPAKWPWSFKVHVLGGFRLERPEGRVGFGTKPPTLSLDILRALAISRDGACSLETLQDWLWPDLDGDQAKAACEQALHRLRRLLGNPDLVIQREGKLRIDSAQVWVDLAAWESRLNHALRSTAPAEARGAALERLFVDFPGPLLLHERLAAWALPVAERVRSEFVDLAKRLGGQRERQGDHAGAQAVYSRALVYYPESSRLYQGLIQARVSQGDGPGALEDFARYARAIRAVSDEEPSPAIRSLIKPFLEAPDALSRRVSDT